MRIDRAAIQEFILVSESGSIEAIRHPERQPQVYV